ESKQPRMKRYIRQGLCIAWLSIVTYVNNLDFILAASWRCVTEPTRMGK
ncbi:10389_t:CDS:2, partial [Rhizophagus irregularis]